ncbi:MAG: hypothetical protein ACJ8AD_00495 [Gemmatimonadaceae bacterium]
MQSVISYGIGEGSFGVGSFVGSSIVGVALVAAFVVLASSRFIQGGVVERPERVPQLYGYTACLVALIWALVSTVNIVESTLILSAPAYPRGPDYGIDPSVSSFEAFRTTYDRSRRMMMDPRDTKLDSIPEPELRRRYEALRADRIERNTVTARRSLITSVFSLIIAAALFVVHWRWLRRVGGTATPA